MTTGLVTGKLTKTGRLWYKIFVSPIVDLFPCVKASLPVHKRNDGGIKLIMDKAVLFFFYINYLLDLHE